MLYLINFGRTLRETVTHLNMFLLLMKSREETDMF